MQHLPSDSSLADVGKTVRNIAILVSAVACSLSLLVRAASAEDANQPPAKARSAEQRDSDVTSASTARIGTTNARSRISLELSALAALTER